MVFGSAAFAHANIVTGVVDCATPLGSGYQVTWTVANNWNLSETAQVADATGGVSTVTPVSLTIPASGDGSGGAGTLPYASVTTEQYLPAWTSGADVIDVTSAYADNFTTSDAGYVTLPDNCSTPAVTPPPAIPTVPLAPIITVPTTTIPPVVAAVVPDTSAVPTVVANSVGAANPLPPVKLAARRRTHAKHPLHPVLRVNQFAAAKPATPIVRLATFTG